MEWTKEGDEEGAAKALILAAKRDFGVMVYDFNFSEAEGLRKENDILRTKNRLLSSGWAHSLDHLEMVRKVLESITLDAVGGCSRDSIGLLAHGAAVFAERMFGLALLLCKSWLASSWMRLEFVRVFFWQNRRCSNHLYACDFVCYVSCIIM